MPTLSELQQWRDKLFESRLSGIRELRDQNGETLTFKSDSEMAAAIAAVDRAIAAAQAGQPNTIIFKTSKGL